MPGVVVVALLTAYRLPVTTCPYRLSLLFSAAPLYLVPIDRWPVHQPSILVHLHEFTRLQMLHEGDHVIFKQEDRLPLLRSAIHGAKLGQQIGSTVTLQIPTTPRPPSLP